MIDCQKIPSNSVLFEKLVIEIPVFELYGQQSPLRINLVGKYELLPRDHAIVGLLNGGTIIRVAKFLTQQHCGCHHGP